MNTWRFIRNNLIHYRRKHLLLALGVAISGAVITGALLVGDSVQYSLNRIVEQRLGGITHVLRAGDRYFTDGLAERVSEDLKLPVSSMLLQEGSAIGEGGQLRINHIQVLGVDDNFDSMAGLSGVYSSLSGDSIIISRNLADRLNKSVGDELLLRIEKASLIPLNAPFVSDAEVMVSVRAVIRELVGEERLGRFNLKVSQTAPFNVFMARSRLQELMDFQGRANVMLIMDAANRDSREIMDVVDRSFSAADAGLTIALLEETKQLQITSDRVFIDENLSEPLLRAGMAGAPDATAVPAEGIITYFINKFQSGDRSTPYSFVSTLPSDRLGINEIIINRWLADDLDAGPGDSIRMSWFEVGPLRELKEVSSAFVVKEIVPMEGRYGDATLMPDLPGLSDAGNCRDWDTGVPIELESIRDEDEDYWDLHGGIPKAFVSLTRGTEMWQNRFGVYTSFRYGTSGAQAGISGSQANNSGSQADISGSQADISGSQADDPNGDISGSHADIAALEAALLRGIEPAMLGFTMESTRAKGEEAAGNGVDFSQLFGGLSFFLLLAGVMLTILLFLLNLESREEQLGILVTLGLPAKMIRRMMFMESMIVALTGAAAGLLLAVVYNRLVFHALNGIWRDVVRTEMMHVEVKASSLVSGMLITIFIALLSFWFPLNRRLRQLISTHKIATRTFTRNSARTSTRNSARTGTMHRGHRRRKLTAAFSMLCGAVAIGLIVSQLARHEVVNAALFFPASGL
ncbi:MAG: ABC transporter permease, partial [Bacteroidetes bacterium]|nr:ABC transporter permease [Bacteroidota bacterium]